MADYSVFVALKMQRGKKMSEEDEERIKKAKLRVKHALQLKAKEIKTRALEELWEAGEDARAIIKKRDDAKETVNYIEGAIEFLDEEIVPEKQPELTPDQRVLLIAIDAASMTGP